MGGHAAHGREDALGRVHAAHVFRAGLMADQNHLLAGGGPGLGVLGREVDVARGGARGSPNGAKPT